MRHRSPMHSTLTSLLVVQIKPHLSLFLCISKVRFRNVLYFPRKWKAEPCPVAPPHSGLKGEKILFSPLTSFLQRPPFNPALIPILIGQLLCDLQYRYSAPLVPMSNFLVYSVVLLYAKCLIKPSTYKLINPLNKQKQWM